MCFLFRKFGRYIFLFFLADNTLVHELLQIKKLRPFPDAPYREYLPDTRMQIFHTWSIWIEWWIISGTSLLLITRLVVSSMGVIFTQEMSTGYHTYLQMDFNWSYKGYALNLEQTTCREADCFSLLLFETTKQYRPSFVTQFSLTSLHPFFPYHPHFSPLTKQQKTY